MYSKLWEGNSDTKERGKRRKQSAVRHMPVRVLIISGYLPHLLAFPKVFCEHVLFKLVKRGGMPTHSPSCLLVYGRTNIQPTKPKKAVQYTFLHTYSGRVLKRETTALTETLVWLLQSAFWSTLLQQQALPICIHPPGHISYKTIRLMCLRAASMGFSRSHLEVIKECTSLSSIAVWIHKGGPLVELSRMHCYCHT